MYYFQNILNFLSLILEHFDFILGIFLFFLLCNVALKHHRNIRLVNVLTSSRLQIFQQMELLHHCHNSSGPANLHHLQEASVHTCRCEHFTVASYRK